MKKNNDGFTIVELIVVIAMLVIFIGAVSVNVGRITGYDAKEGYKKISSAITENKIETLGKAKMTGDIYLEIYRDDSDRNLYVQTIHNGRSSKYVVKKTKLNKRGRASVSYELSDGTKVWLNSESELKYASEFVGEERRVYLTGEAYFEVAHNPNKPFFVEAKNLLIQVLGTSFGVRVYKDEDYALTTLEEGQVNIHTATSSVTLKPGEQAKLHDNEITVNKVNTCSYTAWRNGKYIFINESLGNIMKTLARWYDINIFYTSSKLEQIQFTGELIRYKNIEELLSKFEILEKVKFEIRNNTITIKEY